MAARLSMIVHDLDFLRPLIAPPEYDPPLIVYSDRMLAGEVSSQSFQSVAWRRHEIAKHRGVVQLHQFSAGDLGNVRRTPPLERAAAGKSAPRAHPGSF
jgi:hypothetical protein